MSTAQTTCGTKRRRQRTHHCLLLTSAVIAVPQLHAEFSENNQTRQRTYKRRVRVTIVVVKKQYAEHYVYCVCVCVCVALVFQHAMRMRYTAICGLSGCTTFFHGMIFGGRGELLNIKCVLIFYKNVCLKHCSL